VTARGWPTRPRLILISSLVSPVEGENVSLANWFLTDSPS
jgi:hypothetical protein